jgi:hypothetical protein
LESILGLLRSLTIRAQGSLDTRGGTEKDRKIKGDLCSFYLESEKCFFITKKRTKQRKEEKRDEEIRKDTKKTN